jgi:hypothetical protein
MRHKGEKAENGSELTEIIRNLGSDLGSGSSCKAALNPIPERKASDPYTDVDDSTSIHIRNRDLFKRRIRLTEADEFVGKWLRLLGISNIQYSMKSTFSFAKERITYSDV